MKEYRTGIYNKKPSWEEIPKADIDFFQWESDKKYRPESYAKMCFVKDEGVYVLLMCKEENPRTQCKLTNEKVYHDSCLEMFLSFGEEGYLNIETNANGVYLSEFGKTRQNRKYLKEYTEVEPVVNPVKDGAYWGNEIFFSNEIFASLYENFKGVSSGTIRGNFYKCGDLTEIPHYGSFSPMTTFELGFHDPSHFAYFIVEEKENGKQ